MPIYDYECSACSSRFERRQRFDEEPIAICPECAGSARRVIHSVPVLFKGSGFYCTDHGKALRDSSGRKDEGVEAKSEPKPETKPEVKSEAKTASTSEESC